MHFSICQICEMTSMPKPRFIRFGCLACSLDMHYSVCQSSSERDSSPDLDSCKFIIKNKTSTTLPSYLVSFCHCHKETRHILFWPPSRFPSPCSSHSSHFLPSAFSKFRAWPIALQRMYATQTWIRSVVPLFYRATQAIGITSFIYTYTLTDTRMACMFYFSSALVTYQVSLPTVWPR